MTSLYIILNGKHMKVLSGPKIGHVKVLLKSQSNIIDAYMIMLHDVDSTDREEHVIL